jgi:aryl-alcohol dehydrogenase-like predicted oxidoreductase
VSRICLGCMSYGGGNRGNHAWSLGEEESRPFIKRALEAGINCPSRVENRADNRPWLEGC